MLGIGVRPGMSFIEARRTRLLNLIALPTIPFMLFYTILNFWQERYVLATVNTLSITGNIAVLYLHSAHKYLSARLFLILYSITLYTFSGIYFQNGAEFFLLNILIITLLVYDRLWIKLLFSTITICSFLAIHFMPQEAGFASNVPTERAWANVSASLFFIIIALTYFKQLHTDYLQVTENQRRALATMNRDKEKMFSIVAHDIRSPLATLEGLLDMFQVGEYSEAEMKEAAEILRKKVGQLSGTLDNLLRWSIGQMKGIRTQPVLFELSPLLEEVLALLESGFKQKNVEVTADVQHQHVMFADRDQAAVILRNLISNAAKFSHPGGHVYLRSTSRQQRLLIEVQDEGTGMSAEQMDTLFTNRAEPGFGTMGERGTGLGLMLSQEFAEQNNGAITVQSVPGQGTLFLLDMPALEDEDRNWG